VPLLQTLKETGVRIGEAVRLRWIDVSFESRTIRVTPEKGSNHRILPISHKLRSMLEGVRATSTTERIFPNDTRDLRRAYERQRKRIALKLQNQG
jgi:integrase